MRARAGRAFQSAFGFARIEDVHLPAAAAAAGIPALLQPLPDRVAVHDAA